MPLGGSHPGPRRRTPELLLTRSGAVLGQLLASAVAALPGLGWLDIQATVAQFEGTLAPQVSLEGEAAHLRTMGRRFGAWRDVVLPQPLLATPALLVESYVEATPLSYYMQHGRVAQLARAERHYIVQRGVDIYLKMLLHDNLMHADLHPGNILYTPHPRAPLWALNPLAGRALANRPSRPSADRSHDRDGRPGAGRRPHPRGAAPLHRLPAGETSCDLPRSPAAVEEAPSASCRRSAAATARAPRSACSAGRAGRRARGGRPRSWLAVLHAL